MNFLPNPLFIKITKAYLQGKRIICNEGGSRSGKTWTIFHWLVRYCLDNDDPKEIYIIRDTLVNCRDYTLVEFQNCLKLIGIYEDKNLINSPKPVYNLWGHKIKFRGLDDEQSSEGYPSDIIYFNEALENESSGMKGLMMRCRDLILMDWNPKFTMHETFELEKRPDAVFLRTTYLDNVKNLPKAVIDEIEGYNPEIPANLESGTADPYRWKVYGKGERANREGLVFPDVTWVEAFPEDIDQKCYGLDFGKTNETAIVEVGMRRRKDNTGRHDLFLRKLFYQPTKTSDIVIEVVQRLGIAQHIWCDCNLPGWIADMRRKEIQALATKKFDGSRDYWITSIKKFNIHIVKDIDFRKEQENFSYRVVDGITLSETIKKHDHLWSATGYAVVGDLRTTE